MLRNTAVTLILFVALWCGQHVQQQQTHVSHRQHQVAGTVAADGTSTALTSGQAHSAHSSSYLHLPSALQKQLQRTFQAARALLSTDQQRANTSSSAAAATAAAMSPLDSGSNSTASSTMSNGNGTRNGNPDTKTLQVDSANLQPELNPAVINATRPPAPAPAPTSAAAGEANQEPYTGPTLKRVSEVTAGDSCVCWTSDWCTCGWQSCPYKPPDKAVPLPSEAAQRLFGPDVLPQLTLSGDLADGRAAPPLTPSMLRRFNKRISTQLINPLYQFTTEHYILEGAREVVAAGGDSFKFNLANLDARGNPISNVRTPLDMVRSPSLPYADVFDLPLSMFFFWVFPNYTEPYKDTYELAVHLLQKYQGTGKQFFIGMWEGDHALRKPGNLGHNVPPDPARMETLQYVIQEKQRAVDNAKRDMGDCQNVFIWNYVEANFVLESIWSRSKISIINWLVPTIDSPPVDYISYSAYEVLFSGDWKLVNLTAAFDYMAQRLPEKPGVPGPRVFLGEWAYPMYDVQGRPGWDLEQSREKGLYAAAVAIAWGSQFNQYWQLYSNHRLINGTGDRGFWLVKPNRRDTPIWTSMKDYFAASDIFVSRFWACYGGWPSDYTYRVWAVKTLMKLVNNGTKPEPVVRDHSSARYFADNTFGQLGPTITFRVSEGSPADEAATQSSSYIPIRPVTPPLVPQFLPTDGNRGNCPLPKPMLPAGVPAPKPPAPALAPTPPVNASGNATRPVSSTSTTTSSSGSSSNGTAASPRLTNTSAGKSGSAESDSGTASSQPKMLIGFTGANKTAGVQEDKAVPLRTTGAKSDKCETWSKVQDRMTLTSEKCPINYPKITVDDVASGKAKPYTYGGIDRLGCANCQQKGLWPNFCLWRRTEVPLWDSISCNQRESTGRSSVQRNLDLAVELTRHWPRSTGINVPLDVERVPPGPAEITPCDVFRLIRGRTLWIIGDSQMKGLYTALKCFMLEFWDLKQYAPTWNTTTLDYLDKLPRNAEAKCIHLPESTRICQLKVLWADTFAEKPSASETRWAIPVWPILQQHLAAPDDIFVINFGLWYDPKNPTRYYNNLQSVGQAYQAAKSTFPNWFFVETVKLHWPDPPGDQDGPRTVEEAGGMETCKPTTDVVFDVRTSELKRATQTDAAAIATAAGQLVNLGVVPVYQMQGGGGEGGGTSSNSSSSAAGGSSSSGRHRRRLLGFPVFSSSSSSSSTQTGEPHLSWLQSARKLLQASLQRTLLQQQQNATSGTAAGNNTASSSSSSNRSAVAGSTAATTGASNVSNSSSSYSNSGSRDGSGSGGADSRASSTAGTDQTDADGPTQFPRLRPTFAVTASATADSSSSSSSSSTVRLSDSGIKATNTADVAAAPAAAAASSPAPTRPSPSPSLSAAAAAAATAGAPSPQSSPSAPPAAATASAPAPRPILAPGFGSVTLPPEMATEAVLTGLWRNQIARALLRDRFGMAWVPIYNATVPAYWGHRNSPSAPDCIHYCNPGAPQNWMAKLMLAIAVNTKPLEGEITDKRCLWGTRVVYDEGEPRP